MKGPGAGMDDLFRRLGEAQDRATTRRGHGARRLLAAAREPGRTPGGWCGGARAWG